MNNQNDDIDNYIDTPGEIVENIIKESNIQLMVSMPKGTTETTISGAASAFPTIQLYVLQEAIAKTIERLWAEKDEDGDPIFKQDEMEEFVDEVLEMVKGDIMKSAEEHRRNQTDLD